MKYETAEELESRLSEAEGVHRIDILNGLAAALAGSDPERSRELYLEALDTSKSLGLVDGQASAQFGLGESARTRGDYRQAIERYSAALKAAELYTDLPMQGRSLRRLGDLHYFLANLDLSLRYYLQALRVFEEAEGYEEAEKTVLQTGHLLSAIGNVLKSSGDQTGAMDYYRQSLDIYQRLGYEPGIPGVRYNIGIVMQEKGMHREAEEVYRDTLVQALDRGDDYLTSLARNSLGSIHLTRGDFGEAEDCFQRSMETSRRLGRKRGILVSLLKILELRRLLGENDSALEFSGQAEDLALELGDKSVLCDVLREKARVLESAGDHRSAYDTLCRFLAIQQEQLSEKRVRQIDVLRLYYETEEREREIEQLSLTNMKLAREYSKAEELTRIDALTGLANRRAAVDWLASQQELCSTTGAAFGVILGDIDGFKSCNDMHGHDCGDAILVQLARRLDSTLRKHDLAVRWGGEEFLVLLPETDLESAVLVAEALRAGIEAESFLWKGTSIPITMTFGVCQGGDLPVDEAIRLADQAMYSGKHLGKNRVESCAR